MCILLHLNLVMLLGKLGISHREWTYPREIAHDTKHYFYPLRAGYHLLSHHYCYWINFEHSQECSNSLSCGLALVISPAALFWLLEFWFIHSSVKKIFFPSCLAMWLYLALTSRRKPGKNLLKSCACSLVPGEKCIAAVPFDRLTVLIWFSFKKMNSEVTDRFAICHCGKIREEMFLVYVLFVWILENN